MKRPKYQSEDQREGLSKNMSHAYHTGQASYGYAGGEYDVDSQSFRIVRPPVEIATGHTLPKALLTKMACHQRSRSEVGFQLRPRDETEHPAQMNGSSRPSWMLAREDLPSVAHRGGGP